MTSVRDSFRPIYFLLSQPISLKTFQVSKTCNSTEAQLQGIDIFFL